MGLTVNPPFLNSLLSPFGSLVFQRSLPYGLEPGTGVLRFLALGFTRLDILC